MASKQVSSMLIPEQSPVLVSSGSLSMRHRRFACARLPDPYMTQSQPRLLTMTFTTADFSSSWQSPPTRRPRCLHLSHSTTPARLLDTTPPNPFHPPVN